MVEVSRYHYRVQAERSGDWWAIRVPDLPGAFSQARRLAQVEDMARDLIAFALEVDVEDVSVTVEPALDDELAKVIERAATAREEAARAARGEREAIRNAASVLRSHGLAQGEIGQLLNLSHQRIHQILKPSSQRRGSKRRDASKASAG